MSQEGGLRPGVGLLWVKNYGIYAKISGNVIREIARYLLLPSILIAAWEKSLVLYQANTEEITPCPRPVCISPGSHFTLIDSHTAFVFSGKTATTSVVSFDLTTFQTRKIANMNTARRLQGVVCHLRYVYVFGGYGKEIVRKCEKIHAFRGELWEELSELPVGNCVHSAAVSGNVIYLAPVLSEGNIVEFHPETSTFRVHPAVSAGNIGVSFTLGSTLWLPSYNQSLEVIHLHSPVYTQVTRVSFLQKDTWQLPCCSSTPALYGSEVLWLSSGPDHRLIRVHTQSLTVSFQPLVPN